MKVFILIACLAVAVSANKALWEDFKSNHKKSYKSLIEERLRHQIFLNNLDIIEKHNVEYEQGLTSFKKGVNQFADWTREEFGAFLKLSGSAERPKTTEKFQAVQAAPDSIDWRSTGSVTPVKDQGSCGSCWAFSTTGSLESQLKIQKGKLISLSEQNLVDCAGSYGNEGCNGGLMTSAFEYIQDHGINSEAAYPYEERDRRCRFNASAVITKVSGYVQIQEDSEEDLLNAVGTVGPVSVSIDASDEFQFYESGLFTDRTCDKAYLNHGVLAVGYGSENGKDFWIVKNSWGPSWGERGYIRMNRGKNMCGIASDACYPKL
ncbi:unnamed protein product [Brassicogethes aeneus]|uniref:Cathepsin L n=1 Tax=Brassicogethes aeneus TaxID=1431903 RepID=A0A9P0FA91_BRAAE|nr:unnamed protein product [Brassicogethes aeneus]